jgi:hypothetical protein
MIVVEWQQKYETEASPLRGTDGKLASRENETFC